LTPPTGLTDVIRGTNLRVVAAVLAWLIGTLSGLLTVQPRWVVVAAAAVALGAGIVHGAEYRRRVTVFVALVLVGTGAAAYFVESDVLGGDEALAVPPVGATINAQTGEIAHNAPRSTSQMAQIEWGSIFRSCDRTTEHPCRYSADQGPIRAHPGDLIEFGVRLHNPNDAAVPFARFTVVLWGGGRDTVSEKSQGRSGRASQSMTARLDISFHTGIGSRHIEEKAEVDVLGARGYTTLNYVPGSTVLRDRHHHLVARLPDGIMDAGLALADIGSPASCYFCDIRYTRFIFFEAKVNGGRS
jgi:hypothetical protein